MKISHPVVFVAIGIMAASLTFFYQPKEWAVVGNVCDGSVEGYCFQQLPTAGFPLAYMHDDAGTSVLGHIGIEDTNTFEFGAFIFDSLVFALLSSFIAKQRDV